jgi:L-Ala-D/L-Glu epimerase
MTAVRELSARELRIPFKTTFRHAAAERAMTSTVWVEAVGVSGATGYGEGCPRPYVTGETVGSATAFIAAFTSDLCQRVNRVATLQDWMADHRDVIDRNPAAWCAIELALLDLFARDRGQTVDQLLGLPIPSGPFHYTAVVGDNTPEAFEAAVSQYRKHGFLDFKIKLSGEVAADRCKLEVFQRIDVPALRVRVDANNVWENGDAAITFLRQLEYPLLAVEEPVGAGQYVELARISDALGCKIVLDESVVRIEQVACLPPPSSRWIVNVRVSKLGGLLRSLAVVGEARARGMGVIVGAQVGETSLLTRVGLSVATAAGSDLLAQEGAFGTHLLQHDVCEPPLMFGEAGILRPSEVLLTSPGFGLSVRTH